MSFFDFNININPFKRTTDKSRDIVPTIPEVILESELQHTTWLNTVPFVPEISYGKVIKVYDGDTITIASKMPYNKSPIYRFSVRLRGIDSPEIRGKTAEETLLAKRVRDTLHDFIFGKIVTLKNVGTEKYGRLLADVYVGDVCVNSWMLEHGYAVQYDGGTKTRPEEWDA